jgi:hypothetical protein
MAKLPLKLLCSTKFGRYPKISLEQVYNMFQSDGWMVNYAGYEFKTKIAESGASRGMFYSSRLDQLFAVINQYVYSISTNFVVSFIGTLSSISGDVFIDENIKSQIAFCDKQFIYIFDYSTGVFQKLNLDFSAGYITYQDNRFIASINSFASTSANPITPGWRVSDANLLAIQPNPGGTITIVNPGSGYTNGDILAVLYGHGGSITVTVDGSGAVTSAVVTPETTNSGYSNATYDTSGGTGTGCTVQITVTSGFTNQDSQVGSFQTKPDNVQACVRMPGKTGQLLIMGEVVTEVWTDLGLQLFKYQRNISYCIDYGCLNPATIATGDDFIVWLGANEKSGPVIMVCTGGGVQQISTDGINYRLSQLTNPENSYGFVFKQDGHVFYQLTFPSDADNVTYTYDFNTQKFYTLCDTNQDCHIAKRVVYFNNDYYFVSFDDANLYRLDSSITTNNGQEIPRIIITSTSAMPDRLPFVVNSISFPIEQGADKNTITTSSSGSAYIIDNDGEYLIDNEDEDLIDNFVSYTTKSSSRVDLSTSSDGGNTFGNPVGIWLNKLGSRRNIFKFYNLGRYNEVIFQLRFWGLSRFVLTDGVADVIQ